jgi:DNA repair exonuclease SbcCD ATPase subunit
MEVAGHPISLFPAIDFSDPEWNFRIAHYGHMLGDLAEETLHGTIRFMNVQHHYQILLRRGMSQLTSIAQGHYRNADRQVTQIEELQALVTEKEEIIAERNETIVHREDQINESDTIITQCNAIIEFLQEQVHDLNLEVDDTVAHINELQQQPVPPVVLEALEGEEEEPEEIEGVSDLDSEHRNPEPNPQPNHPSSGSQSSIGNLDDF